MHFVCLTCMLDAVYMYRGSVCMEKLKTCSAHYIEKGNPTPH